MPTPKILGPKPAKNRSKVLDSTIAEVLDRLQNATATAEELGISRQTVYRRLALYGYPEVSAADCFMKARDKELQQLRLIALSKFTNETLLNQLRMYK